MEFKVGDKIRFTEGSSVASPDPKMPDNVYVIGCVHNKGLHYFLTEKSLEGRTETNKGSQCYEHKTWWTTNLYQIEGALTQKEIKKKKETEERLIKKPNPTYKECIKILDILNRDRETEYRKVLYNTLFSKHLNKTLEKVIQTDIEDAKEKIEGIKQGLHIRKKIVNRDLKTLKDFAKENDLELLTTKEYTEGIKLYKTKQYLLYTPKQHLDEGQVPDTEHITTLQKNDWMDKVFGNINTSTYTPYLIIGIQKMYIRNSKAEIKKELSDNLQKIKDSNYIKKQSLAKYAKEKEKIVENKIKNSVNYTKTEIRNYKTNIEVLERQIIEQEEKLKLIKGVGIKERIQREIKKIEKINKIDSVIIKSDNTVVVKTKPVIIKDTEEDSEQEYRYRIGEFIIHYKINEDEQIESPTILNINNTIKETERNYQHPHITGTAPHGVCWGNMMNPMNQLRNANNMYALTILIVEFLWSYNREGDYRDISYWKKIN